MKKIRIKYWRNKEIIGRRRKKRNFKNIIFKYIIMSRVREFFKKAVGSTRKFFNKADSAVEGGLKKAGGIARQIGNIASSALPLAAVVAPELAPAIALAGIGSNAAKVGIDRARQVQKSVRRGVADVKNTIQAPLPPVDTGAFNPPPMFA
jgi:hypothetical protein